MLFRISPSSRSSASHDTSGFCPSTTTMHPAISRPFLSSISLVFLHISTLSSSVNTEQPVISRPFHKPLKQDWYDKALDTDELVTNLGASYQINYQLLNWIKFNQVSIQLTKSYSVSDQWFSYQLPTFLPIDWIYLVANHLLSYQLILLLNYQFHYQISYQLITNSVTYYQINYWIWINWLLIKTG